jgi:hypothetical protein
MTVDDDPKKALEEYILELENDYYPWYETTTRRNYTFWSITQGAAIVAGLLTALVASLASESDIKSFFWIRLPLVSLPLIGTFASALLMHTRVRDLFVLREQGRQGVQALASRARAEFAAAKNPEECTAIHLALIEKVAKLEGDQSTNFFSVVPDLGASGKK